MRAGDLRHRITIQQATETRSDSGATIQHWSDYVTVWASFKEITGREWFAAQQVNAEVSGEFGIRYRTGITPKMRILLGARVFDIQSPPIDPDGRRRELRLMVTEVV